MSATDRPASDAAPGRGDTFDAEYAALVAGQDAPAQDGEPARQGPPATPEAEDEGRFPPLRDERGRFTTLRQDESREAPPAQEQPPAQAAQPPPEQPVDKAAQLEARLAELERNYTGNLRQKDQQIEALRQQFAQGEQTWREQQERRIADERKRLGDDLERQIAQARAANPNFTEQDAQYHRERLAGTFAQEDLARERAERQAERERWEQAGATMRQQVVLQQLPAALGEYAPQMAALARQHHGGVTDDEARAFLTEPQIQRAIRETLPLGREAVNTLSGQFAYVLAQRAHLAAQQREAAAQRQLADNRAAAAGNGATRELVPGSAGPTDPDLARFQSRPGNEGDHFDALWAATRQEQ
jgi:hypothetical protein